MSGGGVVGREAELEAVEQFLAAAPGGLVSLVIEGEPGIGKTTLWREAVERAGERGYRVLSSRPAEAEAKLSYTGLADLLGAVSPDAFEALPAPQRRALEVALLRADPEEATLDRRAVFAGFVATLTSVARVDPLVIAVDDLQWLDAPSAGALEFALRRIDESAIGLLVSVRLGGGAPLPAGFERALADGRCERLRLGPLSLAALHHLLSDRLGHTFSRPTLVKLAGQSGGNPFYALEIGRELLKRGQPSVGDALGVPDDLRDLVATRIRRLPRPTRDALLRVSALAHPTVSLVDPADLAPAEGAGVVRIADGGRIEFTHPLLASAVYAGVSRERRRRLHKELAALAGDVEERARHLSLGTDGPDQQVAAVLEEAAEHAYRRGAPEVAAELQEQAARRTPAHMTEAGWERCLRAGRHHLKAGDPERARTLAAEVVAAFPPSAVRARALHLLAEVYAFEEPQTAIPFLEEALACAGDDGAYAAQLEISLGVIRAGMLDLARADRHLGRAVQLAELAGETPLLAEAIASKAVSGFLLGQGVDEAGLQRALALEDTDREARFQMRPSFNAALIYEFTGQTDLARDLLSGLRERIAARGEETDLPWILAHLAMSAWLAGDPAAAAAEADEALQAAVLTGEETFCAFALTVRAMVSSIRGETDAAYADGTEALAISERIGWSHGVSLSRHALGFLALSKGDPRGAAAMLEPVLAAVEAIGVYEWPIAMSVPDSVEAFVTTGEADRATRLTDAFVDWGRAFDRPWALATGGRCRGLLLAARHDLDGAVAALEEALVHHERLEMPFERGRTLLVLGRTYGRRREKRVARETLEQALAVFERLGAPLWADNARVELQRISGRRPSGDSLTKMERRVAELAALGHANKEIASELFLSVRTVEEYLTRVYRKLGLRSRAQLAHKLAVPAQEDAAKHP